MRSTIMTAISVVLFDLLQHKVREISLSKQIYSHIISGSSRKWSDSTWTHRKQLEQLLQQVTTLRGDIASSRPMQTKGCCKGNNYEQRFARTVRMRIQGEGVPFYGTFSRHGIT